MAKLVLSHTTMHNLWTTACAAPEVEVCGLIGRTRDAHDTIYAATNVHAAPAHAFEISPHDQIRAFKHMRRIGARLLAVYHSHPTDPAVPSNADGSGLGYPEAYTLIIAPSAPRGWQIRAWNLGDKGFTEIPLTVDR